MGLCLGNFGRVEKLADIGKVGGLGKLAVELADVKKLAVA
jgi:hypothetical protein